VIRLRKRAVYKKGSHPIPRLKEPDPARGSREPPYTTLGRRGEIQVILKRARQWRIWFGGILFLALASCSAKDDERALQELVEKAARLAEQHDIGEIMELTSGDFMARPGELDHRGTKRILFMAFRHYGDLKVLHPRPKVDFDSDEKASVSVPFLIVKRDQSLPELKGLYSDPKRWVEEVGEGADLYRIKLQVQKVNGAWLVGRANLERFTGLGFSG
jgi:hypothetical protein